MFEPLPYEIINHISTFLPNTDHGKLITSTSWIYEACHDETKKKYATKKGSTFFCDRGNLEMVKYCHRIGLPFTTHAMVWSAENGHLEIVTWLHENRNEGCTTDAMDWAAMNGHLEMVQWLHENRTEGCTTYAMDYAAYSGHLETVQWLHENRTEGCTTYAMDWAVRNGHLEIVEYLKKTGY